MIFHEIYGCYYQAVAEILRVAVRGDLTQKDMEQIVKIKAFSESALSILPALQQQQWQLLQHDLHTPLQNMPSRPLTILEKRWLKAISLDPKIKLFIQDCKGLEDVTPLFVPKDYVVFDRYEDGDPFEDETYIKHFRMVLSAIRQNKSMEVTYTSNKGKQATLHIAPYQMEYSKKDDKFRVWVVKCSQVFVMNIANIQSCKILEQSGVQNVAEKNYSNRFAVLLVKNGRNAVERAMLHFSHFKKEAWWEEECCFLKLYYDKDDETELLIRILSFGPFVMVTQPPSLVKQIKKRLARQKILQSPK